MSVSVIIPTYNRISMLPRAIRSVLAQEGIGKPEVIVVDDGSVDGTAGMVRKHFPDVELMVQENAGPGAARNRGIERSKGDYLAFLDSDDEMTAGSLAVRRQVLEANPDVAMVCGDYINVIDGVQSGYPFFERLNIFRSACLSQANANLFIVHDFFAAQLQRPVSSTITMMLHRKHLRQQDQFDESLLIGQDWEFALRYSYGRQVGIVTDVVAKRHVHDGNWVHVQRQAGRGGLAKVDRAVLAYPWLTNTQRAFVNARLADNLYEHAYHALWTKRERRQAFKALAASMRLRISGSKLKLLLACCLPMKLARRARRTSEERAET